MSFYDDCINFFNEFDKPSESEFQYTLARLRWKDEKLAIQDVQDLEGMLNELASPIEPLQVPNDLDDVEYIIQPGIYLESILIAPAIDCSPWLAKADGTAIVPIDESNLTTVDYGSAWRVGLFAAAQPLTIVLKGLPQDTMVYFIKRKVK